MAVWNTSQYNTVTGSSQELGTELSYGAKYVLSVTTDTWFKVGATGLSATVGADSHFVAGGGFRVINSSKATEGFVAVLKHTGASDGACSISQVSDV